MPGMGPDAKIPEILRAVDAAVNSTDPDETLSALRAPHFSISPEDRAAGAKRPAVPPIQQPKTLPDRAEPFLIELAGHVGLFDLPSGCAELLKKSLCAPRPEVENSALAALLMRSRLLSPAGAETESETSARTQKPALKSVAEKAGAAYFLAELADKDPGLLETMCEFYAGREIDLNDGISRLQSFWEKEKFKSLLIAHTLALREQRGENSVLASQVFSGMLRPFLDLSHKPRRRFFDRFDCPGERFSFLMAADNDWRSRDSMLLNSITAKAPQALPEDVACHPVLKFIFKNLSSDEDILKALTAFTEKSDSLSVDDLYYLTRKMPRGVDSGEHNAFSDIPLLDPGRTGSWGRVPAFRADDLKILFVALSKTTNPIGAERLGEIGRSVRNIVDRSVSLQVDYPKNADKKFADYLKDFYVEQFAAVVRRIVVDPGKDGLEIQ